MADEIIVTFCIAVNSLLLANCCDYCAMNEILFHLRKLAKSVAQLTLVPDACCEGLATVNIAKRNTMNFKKQLHIFIETLKNGRSMELFTR